MKVKFCPKCKSTEIKSLPMTTPIKTIYHYSSPSIYKCVKCGFEGAIFPEADKKNLDKIIKEFKKLNSKQRQK